MFYRFQQFYRGLFPTISSEEQELAYSFLSRESLSLFNKQSLADQRHALDVATDLLQNQVYLSFPQRRILIQAALLHDCGKTCYSLKLWQRVYIVLSAKLPSPVQEFLIRLEQCKSLSMPLTLAQKHPEWGALLAAQAGLEQDVIELIRTHHSPFSEAGKLLYDADNRH
jgi:HD-like signal output (HDOD) protein